MSHADPLSRFAFPVTVAVGRRSGGTGRQLGRQTRTMLVCVESVLILGSIYFSINFSSAFMSAPRVVVLCCVISTATTSDVADVVRQGLRIVPNAVERETK